MEIRAEKWALYFAIDMGLDEIDEDCVARGIEMVKYEEAVEDYLMTFEAKNDESRIQQGVIRLLKKNEGTMVKREVERMLSATLTAFRFGIARTACCSPTATWWRKGWA